MLAKAVVNKLSDSLAVVIVRKLRYTGSYRKAEGLVEKKQERPNRRSRHLVTHSRKVEGKVLVDTQGEKLKAIQLHILQSQWPICKIDAHVFALAYTAQGRGRAVGRHTSCDACRSEGPDTCKTMTELNTEALFTHCIRGKQ